MWRRGGIVTLALALLLAFGPATPRAHAWAPGAEGVGTAMKYIACAGSIVFMVYVPASIFYTTLVCIHAFMTSEN